MRNYFVESKEYNPWKNLAIEKHLAEHTQPGDLLFYHSYGHVAIYIGGGRIVHASNAKDGIKISPNYAYRSVVACRRIF